jgi:copper chaperone CopZ
MKLVKEQITVTGMHCSGCAERVSKVLHDLEGIRSAEVSLTKTTWGSPK